VYADTFDRTVIATGGESIAMGSNTLAYTIGQPFIATPSSESPQIGFWAGQTGEIPEIPEIPPLPPCEESPELTFIGLKDSYEVGKTMELSLQACLNVDPFHRVDLWVVLQMPDGSFLYMTPLPLTPFSPTPQAFQASLETLDTTYQLLQLTLPPGLGGDYTFYAAFIEEGKNPITDGLTVLRSELAVANTVLSNR
ncbi:MAG: hypothetical protein DRR19_12000, partial [Candidatus Parabeggiatoa sp. nov. 1]